MHFKIIVLFCALNFFTSTCSFGLLASHINRLIELFVNEYNDYEIVDDMIDEFFTMCAGITDDGQILTLKKALEDDITMTEFLILLAYSTKELFTRTLMSLSTYEVEIFVRMFNAYDKKGEKDGFLTQDEFNDLIDNGFNLKVDIKESIKRKLQDEDPVHVLQYLAAILKYKKMGNGLDDAQINKCYALYNSSNDFLDSHQRRELFKTLNIVSDKHVELLDFGNVYPAAQELKVLLVFWAEYNQKVHVTTRSKPFLTTEEVWLGIYEFSEYDDNEDGLLDAQEFDYFTTDYFSEQDAEIKKTLTEAFNANESPMCAAQFLKMKLLRKCIQIKKVKNN